MAITANGMIAKENHETPFTSEVDYEAFKKVAFQAKALICGHKTYDCIREDESFFWPECHYFVISSGPPPELPENVSWLKFDPENNLKLIESKGFKEVCIMGGGQTNASFLASNIVDEIYLDVEPYIYLRGIPLFRPVDNFEIKLELLEVKNLSPQTVQLHYKVVK